MTLPFSGGTEHWWMDYELKGFWPIRYASDNHDPTDLVAVRTALGARPAVSAARRSAPMSTVSPTSSPTRAAGWLQARPSAWL